MFIFYLLLKQTEKLNDERQCVDHLLKKEVPDTVFI